MRRKNALEACGMTVFLPARREHYVARWVDPETGRRRERSLGTGKRREAYQLAGELADKIVAGVSPDNLGWLEFCALYERTHLKNRSAGHMQNWKTVKWSVQKRGLTGLAGITSAWVAEWQQELRDSGRSPNTVASYSTRLRAALHWAQKRDLVYRTPWIPVEVEEVPKSRGITLEEHERLIMAVPKVRTRDACHWERLLRALQWCNLRIGELADLSWDADAPLRIDQQGRYPLIRMAPKAHKSRKVRIQPILPQFWAICCETPEDQRHGLVFPIPNGRGGSFSRKRIVRVISAIGRRAGILTNADTGKTATSHDIGRRAFLGKIDGTLSATEAHKWFGHAKFDTTLTFYDTRAAEELAAKMWRAPDGALGGASQSEADQPATTDESGLH